MRKKMHYMNAGEIQEVYRLYENGESISRIAEKIGVSYATVRMYLDRIGQSLNGEGVRLGKNFRAFDRAVRAIKADEPEQPPSPKAFMPSFQSNGEPKDQTSRLDSAWKELLEATADFVVAEVERKNKEIVEQNRTLLETAKKSNLTDFIRERLNRLS